MSLAIHGKDTVCDVAVEIFVRRACRRRIVVLTVGARWGSQTKPRRLGLARMWSSGSCMCLLEAFVGQRDWLEIGFVSGKKTGRELVLPSETSASPAQTGA